MVDKEEAGCWGCGLCGGLITLMATVAVIAALACAIKFMWIYLGS